VSPPGNLYASTIVRLRPSDPPPATLALVAGVAVEEATSLFLFPGEGQGSVATGPMLGPGLRRGRQEGGATELALKWPNDLLLGGAKLAGILLERAEDAVVIGVGVNLAHHPEDTDRPATSLAAHGTAPDPALFLEALADIFARWLARWRGEGLAPIRDRWSERAHSAGTALTARLPDGTSLDGLFERLDADGALILRLADGSRRVIHAGDVFLI